MSYSREFIRRIQDMRRDAGLEVTDFIKLHIDYDDETNWHAAEYLYRFFSEMTRIMKDTRAVDFRFGKPTEKYIKEYDMKIPFGKGKRVLFTFGIEKIDRKKILKQTLITTKHI